MRPILFLAALFGAASALSFGELEDRDFASVNKRESNDVLEGGFDAYPQDHSELTNGTALITQWNPNPFVKRATCQGGNVQCSGYYCDHCGSCCDNGKCADNFGNCCTNNIACSFGFNCCNSFSGCCYNATSFCCSTSSTGCCLLGTTCGTNGCVGTATFVVSSVTVTTTYTQYSYSTGTVTTSVLSTIFGTTTKFVTSTVTSSAKVATFTSYVTSTMVKKRTVAAPVAARETGSPLPRHNLPEPPSPTPASFGMSGLRDTLGELGLLQKRAVTSYIYTYVFVWNTVSSYTYSTSTIISSVNSMSTATSTIVSTAFNGASSTTTIFSTIVVTSSQDVTSSGQTTTTSDSGTTQGITTTGAQGTTGTGTAGWSTGGGGGVTVIISDGSTSTVSSGASTSSASGGGGSGGLSVGAQAGIGAGVGVAGLAAIGAIVFFLLGRKRRANKDGSPGTSAAPMAESSVNTWTPPPPPGGQMGQYPNQFGHNSNLGPGGAGMMAGGMGAAAAAGSHNSYQASTYHDPSQFSGAASPNSPISRNATASPSGASEMMATGYSSPKNNAVEIGGGNTANLGFQSGPYATEYHEMPADHVHEMPSPPQPAYNPTPGQGQGGAAPPP